MFFKLKTDTEGKTPVTENGSLSEKEVKDQKLKHRNILQLVTAKKKRSHLLMEPCLRFMKQSEVTLHSSGTCCRLGFHLCAAGFILQQNNEPKHTFKLRTSQWKTEECRLPRTFLQSCLSSAPLNKSSTKKELCQITRGLNTLVESAQACCECWFSQKKAKAGRQKGNSCTLFIGSTD